MRAATNPNLLRYRNKYLSKIRRQRKKNSFTKEKVGKVKFFGKGKI